MIKQMLFAFGLALAAAHGFAADDPGAKLAKDKNCLACHSVDKKIVGPAYKDVAKKYAGQADAPNKLVAKIMKGGSGVWGSMPMPPQLVSDAEAHQIVAWVLKQK